MKNISFRSTEFHSICLQYAIQLEFLGQHEQALHFYEEALIEAKNDEELGEEVEEHNWVCKSGLALGNLHNNSKLV
jgi:hypothetical protein